MIFKDNQEFDSTVRLIGGFIVFGLFILLLFLKDTFFFKEGQSLTITEAVVHSVLSFAAGWIAGTRGGGKNGNPDPPAQKTIKPFRRAE